MENQNNRQGNNNRGNNGGFMNKVGQTIENVVDAITGEKQNNGQQRRRQNNNR
ncbi:hypothetical protein [Neobacillus sp. YIM B06451]|uniref:hypothetical protein n=1 Tax=Neobacillus sp. YIM B06451 TaxID=3070994 RepID=UPI00292FCF25|nr:hypothetical protein [Neobacillus sp. YIM B06451]